MNCTKKITITSMEPITLKLAVELDLCQLWSEAEPAATTTEEGIAE